MNTLFKPLIPNVMRHPDLIEFYSLYLLNRWIFSYFLAQISLVNSLDWRVIYSWMLTCVFSLYLHFSNVKSSTKRTSYSMVVCQAITSDLRVRVVNPRQLWMDEEWKLTTKLYLSHIEKLKHLKYELITSWTTLLYCQLILEWNLYFRHYIQQQFKIKSYCTDTLMCSSQLNLEEIILIH